MILQLLHAFANCTVDSLEDAYGGALRVSVDSSAELINSTISGCSASSTQDDAFGGAIFASFSYGASETNVSLVYVLYLEHEPELI